MTTYTVAFYFPDSLFLQSPQTFGMTGSMDMIQTQTFINDQIGSLPVTVPSKEIWFSPWGLTNELYSPQSTWSVYFVFYTKYFTL